MAAALPLMVLACGEPERAGSPAAAGEAATATGAADAPAAAPVLALEGEGLRIFTVPSGSARPIPFGTPAASVAQSLTAVLGRTPVEEGEMEDCGARYANWGNGLTTLFDEGGFAGWWVRDGGDGVSTASGVRVGSTRAELEAAYAAHVETSTLGIEFVAGDMAGILDSGRPDARITHLWAGNACIAR